MYLLTDDLLHSDIPYDNAHNELYCTFQQLYYRLFECCVKKKDIRVHSKKRTNSRPFWNHELDTLWEEVVIAERRFLKAPQTSIHRREFHSVFIVKQHSFDKQYRYYKRKYESYKQTH